MVESFDETVARWAAETEQRKAAGKAKMRAVIEQLRVLGVAAVAVEYDGLGDDGQITELVITPEHMVVPNELRTELEDVCDELCPEGYADGDGAFGSFAIDITAGTVVHEHTDRYTEYNTSQEEYHL
jgi:hypothetical protein